MLKKMGKDSSTEVGTKGVKSVRGAKCEARLKRGDFSETPKKEKVAKWWSNQIHQSIQTLAISGFWGKTLGPSLFFNCICACAAVNT